MRNISVSPSTPQSSLQPRHPLVLLACLKLLPLITVALLLSQFVRSIAVSLVTAETLVSLSISVTLNPIPRATVLQPTNC